MNVVEMLRNVGERLLASAKQFDHSTRKNRPSAWTAYQQAVKGLPKNFLATYGGPDAWPLNQCDFELMLDACDVAEVAGKHAQAVVELVRQSDANDSPHRVDFVVEPFVKAWAASLLLSSIGRAVRPGWAHVRIRAISSIVGADGSRQAMVHVPNRNGLTAAVSYANTPIRAMTGTFDKSLYVEKNPHTATVFVWPEIASHVEHVGKQGLDIGGIPLVYVLGADVRGVDDIACEFNPIETADLLELMMYRSGFANAVAAAVQPRCNLASRGLLTGLLEVGQ